VERTECRIFKLCLCVIVIFIFESIARFEDRLLGF
jgi:hypothetical protein